MLEVHGLDVKGQVVLIVNLPAFGKLVVRPVSAAGIGADVAGIIALPLGYRPWRIPDHLWVRAHQNELAPPFQPLAAAGVQHLIFLPFIGNPEHWVSSLFLLISADEAVPAAMPAAVRAVVPAAGGVFLRTAGLILLPGALGVQRAHDIGGVHAVVQVVVEPV